MTDSMIALKTVDASVTQRVLEHIDDGQLFCVSTQLTTSDMAWDEQMLWWQFKWVHPLFGNICRQHLSDVLDASGLAASMALYLLKQRIVRGARDIVTTSRHFLFLPWVSLSSPGFVEFCAEICSRQDAKQTTLVIELTTQREIDMLRKRLLLLELYGFKLAAVVSVEDEQRVIKRLRYFSVASGQRAEFLDELSAEGTDDFSTIDIDELIRPERAFGVKEDRVVTSELEFI